MKKAFTLVEVMITVAIIIVLATLAIAMVLRNRITANEALAVSSCKSIVTACQSYYAGTSPHSYPLDLATLGPGGASGPAYIDSVLASGRKSGYDFIYVFDPAAPDYFILYGEPVTYSRTGNRYFYADETGRITAKEGSRAGPNDTAL